MLRSWFLRLLGFGPDARAQFIDDIAETVVARVIPVIESDRVKLITLIATELNRVVRQSIEKATADDNRVKALESELETLRAESRLLVAQHEEARDNAIMEAKRARQQLQSAILNRGA